jgi:hypothetical protein
VFVEMLSKKQKFRSVEKGAPSQKLFAFGNAP